MIFVETGFVQARPFLELKLCLLSSGPCSAGISNNPHCCEYQNNLFEEWSQRRHSLKVNLLILSLCNWLSSAHAAPLGCSSLSEIDAKRRAKDGLTGTCSSGWPKLLRIQSMEHMEPNGLQKSVRSWKGSYTTPESPWAMILISSDKWVVSWKRPLWATGFENKLRTSFCILYLCISVGAGGDLCQNLDDCQTPSSSLPSWTSQASQKILILLTPNQGFGDQVRSSLGDQLWSATDSFKCFNCDPGSWVTLWEPLVAAYYSYDANIFKLYRAIGWWNLPKLGIAFTWTKRVQSREKSTVN